MRRAALWLGWLAVGVLSLFCCANGMFLAFQVPFVLAFGWIEYLAVVVPKVRVDVAGVGLFAVAVPLAAALAHNTCRWLYDDASRRWRWKWTWLGMSVVLLMFVSGIAATGVVHQAGWLIRSPVPLIESSSLRRVSKVRCSSNLKQIGLAIAAHVREGGSIPRTRTDVAKLLLTQDMVPDLFVCRMTNDEKAVATQPADLVVQVDNDRHFSYLVCPAETFGPDRIRRVWMYEPLEYHEDGLNVLYDTGEVEWLDRAAAIAWLDALPSSQPSPR